MPSTLSNRELIQELASNRGQQRRPEVVLGKSATRSRTLRADISQLSTYIIGQPGTGKSNLLAHLFLQNQDHGKILIDPLGKLSNEQILPNLTHPEQVLYFAPYEQREHPIAFNPFDLGFDADRDERDRLAGSLRATFTHLWLSEKYVPVIEMVVQNTLNLLVQFEGMTFLDLARILLDKTFRLSLVHQVEDGPLKDFWLTQYREEMGLSTYNKINEFIQILPVRRVICQPKSSFYLREAMQQGKTLIINLGGLEENAKSLMGGLFVSQVLAELVRRETVASTELKPFGIFVDEFDMFGSTTFETIISKCRQQMASVCIAHQHWGQLSSSMQRSVMQCAYVIAFQIDPRTAQGMHGLFAKEADLANVPKHHAWVRASRKKTGSLPLVDLIRTSPVPPGDAQQVVGIKQKMHGWGREAWAVDNEIAVRYRSFSTVVVVDEKERHDQQEQPPAQVQPPQSSDHIRTLSDWPAGFRLRPSALFAGVGG